MRKLFMVATAFLAMASAAKADVIVQNKLSSTGDLVTFSSVSGDTALATLNGQHTGSVSFRDLTGSTTFTAATNGNDIKIEGTQNLFIQVFDVAHNLVGATTEVFSIVGTGNLFAFAQAVDQFGNEEAIQAFNLTDLFGPLGPGQNGFTFKAINGEVITSLRILDVGGTITDFEHYRLDVAAIPIAQAVPEASTWAMMLLGFAGVVFVGAKRRKNGEANFRFA